MLGNKSNVVPGVSFSIRPPSNDGYFMLWMEFVFIYLYLHKATEIGTLVLLCAYAVYEKNMNIMAPLFMFNIFSQAVVVHLPPCAVSKWKRWVTQNKKRKYCDRRRIKMGVFFSIFFLFLFLCVNKVFRFVCCFFMVCRWLSVICFGKCTYTHTHKHSQNMPSSYHICSSRPQTAYRYHMRRDNDRPTQIPKKKYTFFLLERFADRRAYTVVACITYARTHEIRRCLRRGRRRRRRVAREWCTYRETKLPPILFSKPIISSRASDFIRDSA